MRWYAPSRIGSAILAVAFSLPKRTLHSKNGGRSKQRPYGSDGIMTRRGHRPGDFQKRAQQAAPLQYLEEPRINCMETGISIRANRGGENWGGFCLPEP